MAHSKYADLYLSPTGPGDARPTALEIVKEHGVENQLRGRTIFITGCSSGLGIATARALVETGATLYLTARNLSKADDAVSDLLSHYPDRVHLLQMELGSFESIKKCVEEFQKRSKCLNILICNAGVRHTPAGKKTKDGFETQFGTRSAILLMPVL
jgi:NAD(P)-dependent dehydrogenase (short-subunit alcohol dehydrogenase family)